MEYPSEEMRSVQIIALLSFLILTYSGTSHKVPEGQLKIFSLSV